MLGSAPAPDRQVGSGGERSDSASKRISQRVGGSANGFGGMAQLPRSYPAPLAGQSRDLEPLTEGCGVPLARDEQGVSLLAVQPTTTVSLGVEIIRESEHVHVKLGQAGHGVVRLVDLETH